MASEVFCIYDRRTDLFGTPLFFDDIPSASRYFEILCEKDPVISFFPGDYQFINVAQFDSEHGDFLNYGEHCLILNGEGRQSNTFDDDFNDWLSTLPDPANDNGDAHDENPF